MNSLLTTHRPVCGYTLGQNSRSDLIHMLNSFFWGNHCMRINVRAYASMLPSYQALLNIDIIKRSKINNNTGNIFGIRFHLLSLLSVSEGICEHKVCKAWENFKCWIENQHILARWELKTHWISARGGSEGEGMWGCGISYHIKSWRSKFKGLPQTLPK